MSEVDKEQKRTGPPHFATINLLMRGLEAALKLGAAAEDDRNRLEQVAGLDPLTGLDNRRALEKKYHKLQESEDPTLRRREDDTGRALKPGTHSIVLLDLDHFKAINDTQGHTAGDQVLKTVAAVMRENLRDQDVVARTGGEEFAVLLPNTDSEGGAQVAEDLRKRVEDTGSVTVSIGTGPMDLGQPLDENIERVDEALYAAKERGRNQVVAYSELTSPAPQLVPGVKN